MPDNCPAKGKGQIARSQVQALVVRQQTRPPRQRRTLQCLLLILTHPHLQRAPEADHAWGGNQLVLEEPFNRSHLDRRHPELGLRTMTVADESASPPPQSTLSAEPIPWFGVPGFELATILPNVTNFINPISNSRPFANGHIAQRPAKHVQHIVSALSQPLRHFSRNPTRQRTNSSDPCRHTRRRQRTQPLRS